LEALSFKSTDSIYGSDSPKPSGAGKSSNPTVPTDLRFATTPRITLIARQNFTGTTGGLLLV
jgi:hypothetical protein